MKQETYTTSQCAIKLCIEYSKRKDGTYYTPQEIKARRNRKYEDFSASDLWDGGKYQYSERFALNEAKSFIMENRKNILKAIIFYIDIPNNLEVRLCKWTSRSQFKYMKKHTFENVGGKTYLRYNTSDFLSTEISQRRVQTFTMDVYRNDEPGEGENVGARTEFARMADEFLTKKKIA